MADREGFEPPTTWFVASTTKSDSASEFAHDSSRDLPLATGKAPHEFPALWSGRGRKKGYGYEHCADRSRPVVPVHNTRAPPTAHGCHAHAQRLGALEAGEADRMATCSARTTQPAGDRRCLPGGRVRCVLAHERTGKQRKRVFGLHQSKLSVAGGGRALGAVAGARGRWRTTPAANGGRVLILDGNQATGALRGRLSEAR